jgi:hypothetical protein
MWPSRAPVALLGISGLVNSSGTLPGLGGAVALATYCSEWQNCRSLFRGILDSLRLRRQCPAQWVHGVLNGSRAVPKQLAASAVSVIDP